MKTRHIFLGTGLGAAVIGGLWVIRRFATRPHRMPCLDIGQQVMAEKRGKVQATWLAAYMAAFPAFPGNAPRRLAGETTAVTFGSAAWMPECFGETEAQADLNLALRDI